MTQTLPPIVQALFWLILLLALLGSAFWLNRASARGVRLENDRADLEVYADQAREIDRELGQGRISEAQADASKLEIGRRLVKARDRVLVQGPRVSRAVLGGIAASVALLAGGLYLFSGSPGKGDLPFSARERELLARDPTTLSEKEIVVLLQERARLNPNDPAPHALLGQVLVAAGREQEALRAFQAVLRRAPNDSEALAEAGGVLMRLRGNVAGEDAKAAFAAALKVNPKSPAANFYAGLVDWQTDRKPQAIEAWSRAYQAMTDNPEGQMLIATRAAEVMSALDRGPESGGPAGPMMQGAGDQSALIASMIEARKSRLDASPEDIALRLSLVRVLIMSQRREDARSVLLAGAQRGDNTPFTIALYAVAARGLVAGPVAPSQPVTKR
jgi:cytochrome c-type biogenesis protein CcmH